MANSIITETLPTCACGCGSPVPLAKKTSKRDGTIKGQPTKWLKGHVARVHQINKPIPVQDRFWPRVDRSGGSDACWEWQGRRSTDGYGQVQVEGSPKGAHRIAYELTFGAIPKGFVIRHICDNPPCCNPAHLITGTQKENIADARNRGRLRNRSHLTASDVQEMRRSHEVDRTPIDCIARQFHVSYSAAWQILHYRVRTRD